MAKQVIVMRRDLDVKCGKLIAQGAHASCSFFSERERTFMATGQYVPPSPAEQEWILGRFTKIVLGVDSEAELLDIFEKAKAAGLKAFLIQDAGLTCFKGPTHTCVGIGPDFDDKINAVTGHLKLL